MLILYYNTLWNEELKATESLPEGCEITTDRRRIDQAAAVVFHLPQWKWQPNFLFPKKRKGQLWVAWSMESRENYPRLKNPQFMRQFDLTMTYRLDADVVVSYCSIGSPTEELIRQMRTPPTAKRKTPVAMFISSRIDRSGRREYARELMRYIEVDSYGKFMRNSRLEQDHGRLSKLKRVGEYKFTVAFENARDPDYVTEKFFDPLLAGSVPIYLGAPNIEAFAPGEHCFINVEDFPNPKALAEYLRVLDADEAAYQEYFRWKSEPFHTDFEALLDSQRVDNHVQLCHAVRERTLELLHNNTA